MDNIGEINGILNEEDGNVVSNDVPVAFIGVQFQSEATSVTNSVGTTTATQHIRETLEQRCRAASVGENLCACVLFQTLVHLEGTEGTSTTSVNDTPGDTLMVEAMDLLAAHVVLQQLKASVVFGGDLEPVVGVGLFHAKVGGDHVAFGMVVDGILLEVGGLLVANGAIEAELF